MTLSDLLDPIDEYTPTHRANRDTDSPTIYAHDDHCNGDLACLCFGCLSEWLDSIGIMA